MEVIARFFLLILGSTLSVSMKLVTSKWGIPTILLCLRMELLMLIHVTMTMFAFH